MNDKIGPDKALKMAEKKVDEEALKKVCEGYDEFIEQVKEAKVKDSIDAFNIGVSQTYEPPKARENLTPLDLPIDRFKSALDRRKQNRAELLKWIKESLIHDIDFGRIHVVGRDKCKAGKNCRNLDHYSKSVLFKAGAEKICGALGVFARFPNLPEYEQCAIKGISIPQIILRCELEDSMGNLIASGIGGRQLVQDEGRINKSLKMAEKSAYVDATLRLAGLSDMFTQDLEDSNGTSKVDLDDTVKLSNLQKHNFSLRKHLQSILELKDLLSREDYLGAHQIWEEIPREDQQNLWMAPTKGGILLTKERELMRSNEFFATAKGKTDE